MKPQRLLATATAPGGAPLTLHAHDGHYVVRAAGQALMHSALAASEEQLGDLTALATRGTPQPRILLGGLGLGFTLHRVLVALGPAAQATLTIAELVPEIVAWQRTHLATLHGACCLDDPRVNVRVGDVGTQLAAPARWGVISLDVDNGPAAFVRPGNASLYSAAGLARLARALRPGGKVLVWSAGPDAAFLRRLTSAGWSEVRAEPAQPHARSRSRGYVIFTARRPA
jgi:spermidine synthase